MAQHKDGPPATALPKQAKASGNQNVIRKLRAVAASDLQTLAFLHGQELDQQSLGALRQHPFANRLGLLLESDRGQNALKLIDQGLVAPPANNRAAAQADQILLDTLAADYADIYLTHQLRAAPMESVWLDEDKLILQESMFEIRKWYQHFGLKAENWRLRSDDHLVLQLHFIAHLMEQPDIPIEQPARFMDEHLLRWIEPFAEKIERYCATSFYRGLAGVTAVYLDELRNYLDKLGGYPRGTYQPNTGEQMPTSCAGEQQSYVPGIGPVV